MLPKDGMLTRTASQVTHGEYKGCTTQLYPKDDPWLETDTVFAVKGDLLCDFKPLEGDPKATLELEYNVILAPKDYKGKQFGDPQQVKL